MISSLLPLFETNISASLKYLRADVNSPFKYKSSPLKQFKTDKPSLFI